MPLSVKMHLDKLTCIAESDESGRSEPYLFVTYFWLDGRNIAQPDPVSTLTPVYDGYRAEMPDNVRAGTVITVPPFLANATFEVDPGPANFMLAGAVVLLWEEDETPNSAVLAGRNAYMSGLHAELNKLVRKRIQTFDKSPVTPAEADALAAAIRPQIESAIKSKLSFFQKLFGNQDDFIGYTYVAFTDGGIQTRAFTFPDIPRGGGSNHYQLTGDMTVGPVRTGPVVDLCARPRAALRAKENEVKGLQVIRASLQQQLATAPPAHKAALIARITELGAQLATLEAELPALRDALTRCQERFTHHGGGGGGVVIG